MCLFPVHLVQFASRFIFLTDYLVFTHAAVLVSPLISTRMHLLLVINLYGAALFAVDCANTICFELLCSLYWALSHF